MPDPALRIIARLTLRRIDAWGPAAISASLALVVHDAVTPRTVLLVAAIGLLYWMGYAVNDCFDAPCDARDADKASKNPFVGQQGHQSLAIAAALVMVPVLGVFASFGADGMALFAVGVFVMWAYSVPPLRLKSRPGLDLLTHAAFVLTYPYLCVRLLIDGAWTDLDLLLLTLGFVASLGGQLGQQIRDFDVDLSTDRNFTTAYGLRTSVLWLRLTTAATVLMAVGGLVKGVLPGVALPLGVLCLPALSFRFAARPNLKPLPGLYGALTVAALVYSTAMLWSWTR